MRRVLGIIIVLLILGAAIPAATQAQSNEGRTTPDMRATENGPSACQTNASQEKQCSFPSGTKELYLVVDYQDLPSSPIYMALQDDAGGTTIFAKSETLSGTGTKAYKVTGTDVYNEYVRQIGEKSGQLVSTLGTASLSPYGRLQAAATVVTPLILMIGQLEKFPLDDSARSQLDTAKARFEAARTKITGGMNGNASAQNQAVADALNEATAGNTTLTAVLPGLAGRSDLAFPEVNVAAGRTQTAKLLRNNSIVQTMNWAVSQQALPSATPQPTAGPSDTPAPTPNVSQATLTARAASPTPSPTITPTPAPGTATAVPDAATNTPAPGAAATATPPPATQATQAPVAATAPQATQAAQASAAQPTRPPQTQAQPQGQAAGGQPTATPPTAAAKAAAPQTAAPTTAPAAKSEPTAAPTVAKVAGVVDLSRLTPVADGSSRVAGQASGSTLPLAAVGLAVVALGLGGVALWMRRRV